MATVLRILILVVSLGIAVAFLITQLGGETNGFVVIAPTLSHVAPRSGQLAPHATAVAPERPQLPNGGPGHHRDFTATLLLEQCRPLWERHNQALPFILDSAAVSADTCIELVGATGDTLKEAFASSLAVLLGRTRVSVQLLVAPDSCPPKFVAALQGLLWRQAPSFFVAQKGQSYELRRRLHLFVFAITGGKDGRAVYAERTWGQRTPIQWFADAWNPELRPIVDLHPKYLEDPFKLLTYKISRVWKRVYSDFGGEGYDWYARLWDDNYFLEENLYNSLGRLNPARPALAGKIGWRYLADSAIFPFAGGGAGWFLSRAAMKVFGPSIDAAEKWFPVLRARKDIFLPHFVHDEDVFLTAWLSKIGVNFTNIPGVEHVSPGLRAKQRCLNDSMLSALRWDPSATIYFNYPAKEPQFRIENATYAYVKPIVWHYMSPRRLVALETLLYPSRKREFSGPVPATVADIAKKSRQCYPGVPDGPTPPRGQSVFETPLADPSP